MKLIILLICLLAVAYSQTVVYVGGNCTDQNSSSMVYKIGVMSTVVDNSFQWDSTYIQRIMSLVPSLQTKVSLYPVWVNNFTSDIILPALTCQYDAIIADTGITVSALSMGSVFTDVIEYSNAQAYYSWFINLPKVGNDNRLCEPSCIKAGVCSTTSLQDVANFATNANVPINIRYDAGTFRSEIATELQQLLVGYGFGGAVNIFTFGYSENPLPYILNTNPNNTIEIVYATQVANTCPAISALTANFSVFTTLSNISPQFAFPVCPSNLVLRDLLNFGIYKYRATSQFCNDQVVYNNYCKVDPPLFPNDPIYDLCYNYPLNPICGN